VTLEPEMLEIAGVMAGAVLTLMIFSYLIGDNFLYRLALHLFVGALVGYSFGVVIREVFILKVLSQFSKREYIVVAPVILGILLLIKGFPRHAYIGNFSVAYLIGVGTAVALSGALLGTLTPQIEATGRALSLDSLNLPRLGNGVLIVAGTVFTLVAFTFTARRRQERGGALGRIVEAAAWVGRIFLICAFGVAFAGALTTSLSIFIGRIQYLIVAFFDVVDFLGLG